MAKTQEPIAPRRRKTLSQRTNSLVAQGVRQGLALEAAERAARAEAIRYFAAAGGFKLAPLELHGALLPIEQGHGDEKTRERWAKEGQADLDRKAAEAAKPKQIVHIGFANKSRGPDATRMRAYGYHWNPIHRRWEAVANFEDAKQLAKALGGTVEVEGPDGVPMAAE